MVNFQHQLYYSLLLLKMYDLMTKSLSKRQGKKERFVHHSHEKLITKMFHNVIVNTFIRIPLISSVYSGTVIKKSPCLFFVYLESMYYLLSIYHAKF